MKTLLERARAALRTWLGLADPSSYPIAPNHGWLLPDPDMLLSLRKPVPVPARAVRFKA